MRTNISFSFKSICSFKIFSFISEQKIYKIYNLQRQNIYKVCKYIKKSVSAELFLKSFLNP